MLTLSKLKRVFVIILLSPGRIRYTIVNNQVLSEADDNYNQVHALPWTTADNTEQLQVVLFKFFF